MVRKTRPGVSPQREVFASCTDTADDLLDQFCHRHVGSDVGGFHVGSTNITREIYSDEVCEAARAIALELVLARLVGCRGPCGSDVIVKFRRLVGCEPGTDNFNNPPLHFVYYGAEG